MSAVDVLAAYEAHAKRVCSAARGLASLARAWDRNGRPVEAVNLRANAAGRMARLRKRRVTYMRLARMQRAALARATGEGA